MQCSTRPRPCVRGLGGIRGLRRKSLGIAVRAWKREVRVMIRTKGAGGGEEEGRKRRMRSEGQCYCHLFQKTKRNDNSTADRNS